MTGDEMRSAFNAACDRFDLANDWEGPARSGVFDGGERERRYLDHVHELRRSLDHIWRECDEAGVDVSDIARRWEIGR